jgi:hypothetical protein
MGIRIRAYFRQKLKAWNFVSDPATIRSCDPQLATALASFIQQETEKKNRSES